MTRANTLPAAYVKSLKRDFEAGMSYATLAERYNKPVSTVKYHAYKLGLVRPRTGAPPKVWTHEEDALLRKLWADETVPKTNIGHQCGHSWDSVNDRAKELKLPERPMIRTKKPDGFKWEITPWPENMPRFEDHPKAHRIGKRVFI